MEPKVDSVKAFFDQPKNYLNDNSTIQLRRIIVKELLGNHKMDAILDLGCGDGSISINLLNDYNYLTLVDISEEMLFYAKKNVPKKNKLQVTFQLNAVNEFTLTQKFDVIICMGLLAHVPSIDEVFNVIRRSIKDNGIAIVQITDYDTMLGKLKNLIHKLFSSRKYSLNHNSTSVIQQACKTHHLEIKTTKAYLGNTYGLRKISKQLDYQLKLWSARSTIINNIFPEKIFVIKPILKYDN